MPSIPRVHLTPPQRLSTTRPTRDTGGVSTPFPASRGTHSKNKGKNAGHSTHRTNHYIRPPSIQATRVGQHVHGKATVPPRSGQSHALRHAARPAPPLPLPPQVHHTVSTGAVATTGRCPVHALCHSRRHQLAVLAGAAAAPPMPPPLPSPPPAMAPPVIGVGSASTSAPDVPPSHSRHHADGADPRFSLCLPRVTPRPGVHRQRWHGGQQRRVLHRVVRPALLPIHVVLLDEGCQRRAGGVHAP